MGPEVSSPRLANADEVALVICDDQEPSMNCLNWANEYFEIQVSAPSHVQLRQSLQSWWRLYRKQYLLSQWHHLSESEISSQLEHLLCSDLVGDRELVLGILRSWLKSGNTGGVAMVLHAFVQHSEPDQAIDELLDICDGFYEEGGEQDLKTMVEFIGGSLSLILEGKVSRGGQTITSRERDRFIDSLLATNWSTNPHVAGSFLAIALGGSGEGHLLAKNRLIDLLRADDVMVASLAAVNLGRVTSAVELLSMDTIQYEIPSSPADARFMGNFLCGIYNSLARHPEDVEIASPIYQDVLLLWYEEPYLDGVRQDVLRYLSDLPTMIAELEAVYEFLADDVSYPETAQLARRGLEKLKRWRARDR
jgi:hypothetical protein